MGRFLATCVALSLVLVGISCTCEDTSANKAVVLSFTDAFNSRDFEKLEALLAEDLRRHCTATPDLVVENRDQFIAFLERDLEGVPDARQEIDFLLGEGDLVAGRMFYRGTQTGQMGPYAPSGRRVDLPFIGILRIEEGRIAEIWVEWDNMAILTQLGHAPDAPPPIPAE